RGEIRRVYRPGNQSGFMQSEYLGEPGRRGLLGIGRHNFQIAAWPERQQRVPCAATGMNTAKNRAHAGVLLHPGNDPVKIINSENNVVDTCHAANLYPCPCTVMMYLGCLGSFSSFCRSQATWTSTVRVEGAEEYPQTSFKSSSRLMVLPRCSMR